MKKLTIFISSLLLLSTITTTEVAAQIKYTDAKELTLIGKNIETPNPYHRIDTVKYKGFTEHENIQVRCPAGLAIAFETSSTQITIDAEYGTYIYKGAATSRIAAEGFDLYIRKDGEWLYAASLAPKSRSSKLTLIKDMDNSTKECLLYLPNYSELLDLKIGVDDDATISAVENPFRHKVVIFGSSFTHGIGTSRSGMSYPMQIERNTNIQFCSIACSGNCKLQPYFANYLADVEGADAFVFDAFSNPNADMIRERLIPFIETLRAAHPTTPLIFVETIYRESRNFNTAQEEREAAKQVAAKEMMKIAMKKFDNIYFINSKGFTGNDHITSSDGIHPSDLGYYRWANALQPKLMKILRKYGIK